MTQHTQNQAAVGTYSILHCRTAAELSKFEQIPEILHATDPGFTPPFPGSVVKLIEREVGFRSQTRGNLSPDRPARWETRWPHRRHRQPFPQQSQQRLRRLFWVL
jgi:hypothetical protein